MTRTKHSVRNCMRTISELWAIRSRPHRLYVFSNIAHGAEMNAVVAQSRCD